jgi:hypothetical protein
MKDRRRLVYMRRVVVVRVSRVERESMSFTFDARHKFDPRRMFFAESRIACTRYLHNCASIDQSAPSQRAIACCSFLLLFTKNVATAQRAATTAAEASVRLQIMPQSTKSSGRSSLFHLFRRIHKGTPESSCHLSCSSQELLHSLCAPRQRTFNP